MTDFVLALDQGTTGTTASLLDARGRVVRTATRDLAQHFPKPGWVEHDPMEIWSASRDLLKRVARGIPPRRIAALGLTNQRETVVLWDPRTGRPLHRAIVWQDRRTADLCSALRRKGHEPAVRSRTGLVLDAYFSGTKIRWLLDRLRPRGPVAAGTIDSWLLWNLCGVHATDLTNASRTLLFDIHRRRWDPGLLSLLRVPPEILPEVRPSSGVFGSTRLLGGEIPVAGVAGDQQAALFGQRCVAGGEVKNTYGTGCFAVMNTGTRAVRSRRGLLTTLAVDAAGGPCYALEGSVFIAGAAVQWLRDGLKLIRRTEDIEPLARSAASTGGVHLVPAFVGLGAPWWDMDARGALLGLTRGTGPAEIARAALEAIAFQTADVLEAMRADTGLRLRKLRVDGGATANRFLMQFQADLLGVPVERPADIESTVRGAAFLAGQGTGFWSRSDLDRMVRIDTVFRPRALDAKPLLDGWRAAVRRVLSNPERR